MNISSPDFDPTKPMNLQHAFHDVTGGANISPEVHWNNPPAETKSFAITLYDPDAPTGSGWWHWVVFNIPATQTSLPRGAGSGQVTLPTSAVQGRTDYNTIGYGGPCPPVGDNPHEYILTVYALDVENLPLDGNIPAAMVGFNIHAHCLESASLSIKFGR